MSISDKRPLKVFLCHYPLQGTPTRTVMPCAHSTPASPKDGVDAWLDKEKLLPGQDWELEIRKAVRE